MKIAVTGGTGFIGRYILRRLAGSGHQLRAWRRDHSDVSGLSNIDVEWLAGSLTDSESMRQLADGCDAIVHAALWKPGASFRGGEGNVAEFAEVNIVGSLRLIEAALTAGVETFVFLSTCAVHEIILDDRPLDEAHPLWATSHYGAHKAAIEKFVHSYGLGHGYNICAVRPTGVYGMAHPVSNSKWFDLIAAVAAGHNVSAAGGGKEVHAADVAKAVDILLSADGVAGQAYNCYDRYVSQFEVANIAKRLSDSPATNDGETRSPKHQIETGKLRSLGMTFGSTALLEKTIGDIVHEVRKIHQSTAAPQEP